MWTVIHGETVQTPIKAEVWPQSKHYTSTELVLGEDSGDGDFREPGSDSNYPLVTLRCHWICEPPIPPVNMWLIIIALLPSEMLRIKCFSLFSEKHLQRAGIDANIGILIKSSSLLNLDKHVTQFHYLFLNSFPSQLKGHLHQSQTYQSS